MSVSRTQAEIVKQPDGTWIVRDAGSSNGTFVNGDKLGGDRALKTGDEISMGKYSVLFDRALEVQAQSAARTMPPTAGSEHSTMYLKPDEVKKLTQVSAQKRQAHLDWEIKAEKGTYALAATGAALIGNDDLCDLSISGASNHVLIVKTAEGYEARNLSSFRGMTVKGVKAKRARLNDGDVIEMGGLKLTFKDDLR